MRLQEEVWGYRRRRSVTEGTVVVTDVGSRIVSGRKVLLKFLGWYRVTESGLWLQTSCVVTGEAWIMDENVLLQMAGFVLL